MSEQYLTIEKLYPNQEIRLNSVLHKADDEGAIFLSESMIFPSEFGYNDFEQVIAAKINDKLQIKLYTLWGSSGYILLNSTVYVLDNNKELAKEVLGIGIQCGVLSRGHNSNYKVNTKIMKERMLIVAKHISERINITEKELTETEHRKQVLSEYERPAIKEEIIHNPDKDESVKSTLNVSVSEPAQIPKVSGVQTPKKNSVVPLSGQTVQKPRKPLK
jgi:hypothetical protein